MAGLPESRDLAFFVGAVGANSCSLSSTWGSAVTTGGTERAATYHKVVSLGIVAESFLALEHLQSVATHPATNRLKRVLVFGLEHGAHIHLSSQSWRRENSVTILFPRPPPNLRAQFVSGSQFPLSVQVCVANSTARQKPRPHTGPCASATYIVSIGDESSLGMPFLKRSSNTART